jgi:hypothetical protein
MQGHEVIAHKPLPSQTEYDASAIAYVSTVGLVFFVFAVCSLYYGKMPIGRRHPQTIIDRKTNPRAFWVSWFIFFIPALSLMVLVGVTIFHHFQTLQHWLLFP